MPEVGQCGFGDVVPSSKENTPRVSQLTERRTRTGIVHFDKILPVELVMEAVAVENGVFLRNQAATSRQSPHINFSPFPRLLSNPGVI
jgi:hypothetical protein